MAHKTKARQLKAKTGLQASGKAGTLIGKNTGLGFEKNTGASFGETAGTSLAGEQQGNVVIFIILAFLGISILPPLIFAIFPPVALLYQLAMIFIIYSMVKGYMGGGAIGVIITAILVYFLVFKYRDIYAVLFIFQMLLGMGALSLVIWSSRIFVKPEGG